MAMRKYRDTWIEGLQERTGDISRCQVLSRPESRLGIGTVCTIDSIH